MNKLTEREKNVYLAVCKYYMAQFLPKAVKEKTKMMIELGGEYTLVAYSTVVLKKRIYGDIQGYKSRRSYGTYSIADGMYSGTAIDARFEEKETKPPSRYTKATLNEDMTRIAKYVTDPEVKKMLLEKIRIKRAKTAQSELPQREVRLSTAL